MIFNIQDRERIILVGSTLYITHPDCSLHNMRSWHPESAKRLAAIHDRLCNTDLIWCLREINAPQAEEKDLLRCHTADYLNFIKSNIPTDGYFNIDNEETSLNPHTWAAALRAAGSGIIAVDELMQSRAKNAFCSVRPPGHHAESDKSMGFCFFNNAAIAARYAIEKYGLSRIAIVDFDVHHGNGTEQILANDPHVEMFSFFQHPFFPYSGAENVAPNMHNVPLKAYSGRPEIEEAVREVWLPIMEDYQPELIIICAGFDAHREDDMGQMTLVEQDFVWLTKELMAVADRYCQGRVISFLEGGYNLNALARSAVEHVRALAGFC